jgi:leucyl aminopeptidase
MQIQIESQPYASLAVDALIACVFDDDNRFEGALGDINRGMDSRLSKLVESGEMTGKPLELVMVHFPQGLAAQRLLLIGAGKKGKFGASDLRKLGGTALRYLKSRGAKKLAFLAPEGERGTAGVQALTEGLLWANYESDKYRTEKKPPRAIDSVALAGFDTGLGEALTTALEDGRVIGGARGGNGERCGPGH